MTVLPDTSVWIRYFRPRPDEASRHLDHLIEEREVLGCGPVLAEILAGTPLDERVEIWRGYDSLPWAELDRLAWRQAGEISFALARQGRSLPLADILIAVVAVRGEAEIWTLDRDFERIRDVLPALQLYGPNAPPSPPRP